MLSAASRRVAGSVRNRVPQKVQTLKPSQNQRRLSTIDGPTGNYNNSNSNNAGGSGGSGILTLGVLTLALGAGYVGAYHYWPSISDKPFPLPAPTTNPFSKLFPEKNTDSAASSSVPVTVDTLKEEKHEEKQEEPQQASEDKHEDEVEAQTTTPVEPEIIVVEEAISPTPVEVEAAVAEKTGEVVEEALNAVSEPEVQAAIAEVAEEVAEIFGGAQESGADSVEVSTETEDEKEKTEEISTPGEEAPVGAEGQLDAVCKELIDDFRRSCLESIIEANHRANALHQMLNEEKAKQLQMKEAEILMKEEFEAKIKELNKKHAEETDRLLFEATTKMYQDLEKTIKEVEAQCELRNAQLHQTRIQQIVDVQHQVLRLKTAALSPSNAASNEQRRQLITLSLAGVIMALQQNKTSLKKELHDLFVTAGNRPDILAVLGNIPKGFISGAEPVQSREDLKNRFDKVLQIARTQSMVPEDGGLFWQLWASLVSKVSTPLLPNASADDKTTEGILARSAYYVKSDDFNSAIQELKKLEGNSREVVESWLHDAHERLLLEESLLRADRKSVV